MCSESGDSANLVWPNLISSGRLAGSGVVVAGFQEQNGSIRVFGQSAGQNRSGRSAANNNYVVFHGASLNILAATFRHGVGKLIKSDPVSGRPGGHTRTRAIAGSPVPIRALPSENKPNQVLIRCQRVEFCWRTASFRDSPPAGKFTLRYALGLTRYTEGRTATLRLGSAV